MPFDIRTLAKAAFKRINTRAHTSNSKELSNESIPSNITLTFENIIGETISPTGSQAVSDGVALHLSGSNVLSATLDTTSNGKAYFLTIPSGNILIGQAKPGGGNYTVGDRAQRLIPQSFGLDYRPILRSNGVEVPPFDTRDWFLDEFAGIITSEEDLELVNGSVECYVYVGQYLDQIISSGTSGSGAPSSASYITVNNEPGLPNERVLSSSTGITIADNGPGSTLGIGIDTARFGVTPICNEIPSGALDGTNNIYTLSRAPIDAQSVMVYINGQRQRSGSSCDYVISGNENRNIITSYNLRSTDNIIIDYFISGTLFI